MYKLISSIILALVIAAVGSITFLYQIGIVGASESDAPAVPIVMPQQIPLPIKPAYFYVTVMGDDATGDGTRTAPWGSISHALTQVPDASVILVGPGRYDGHVALDTTFQIGVSIRSEEMYRAQLRHDEAVVTSFLGQGITLQGFDIAHSREGAERYVIQIQDLLSEDISGGDNGVARITLRNNIIHDSTNNDLIKVNNGAQQILIEGNLFYNPRGSDSHIDVNSVTDVTIQDNIFFNDFAGSGVVNNNDTGSFIVIKDSNEGNDANLGSHNIKIRRNLFFNWEGHNGNYFIAAGEEGKPYYVVMDLLIENNLFLGNADNLIRAPFGFRGVRGAVVRHNTIVGDLPAKAYGMRLSRGEGHPLNIDIAFYNNIWSDPTGSMGAETIDGEDDFSDSAFEDSTGITLLNNLYWNGGEPLPTDEAELVNVWLDTQRLESDPALPDPEGLILPRWDGAAGQFADGSFTIRELFVEMVIRYGVPAAGSTVIDAADPAHAAEHDILGRLRPADGGIDIGAYER